MIDYVANCMVSQPIYLPGLKADVDMGGLKFSYQYGLFYTPAGKAVPLQPPPPSGTP